MVKRRTQKGEEPELISLDDALSEIQNRFSFAPRVVKVSVQDSIGRVTAEALYSPLTIPSVHLSAMDGIAVKEHDTIGATDKKPVRLTDFVLVNTGNVIPPEYNAVIKIEDTEEKAGSYTIRTSASPWQHIRPIGEDISRSEMVLPRYSQISAPDIGAMISYGITEVPVLDLKVALISTGSEIISIGSTPRADQVIESNMHMAAAMIRSVGASVTHFPIVVDNIDEIRNMITIAVKDHDLILISGGSSKGTMDYTSQVIDTLGTVFVHGIAIKPAKQLILGDINQKVVIGMPGYPVAFYTVLREIVQPILEWYRFPFPYPDNVSAYLTQSIRSSFGLDEFILAIIGKVQENWVATPLSNKSGVQMNLVRSNAYLKVPSDTEEVEKGTRLPATLRVQKEIAEQTVLVTGSHDLAIDYLADLAREEGILIASSHVGSMNGLLTLQEGYCHLAPMHLLADDGEYNIPYLQQYIPKKDLVLISVAERMQGVVSRDVLGFDAITTHTFINRQKGSGTRMLLDHLLHESNIRPEDVHGYDQEVSTHYGVCLAVQNGDADIGMTIYGAARAFSLPFIPLALERYELVTTKELFEEDWRIRKIVELINSKRFKEILTHLGGYEMEFTGTIRECAKKRYMGKKIR